MAYLECSLLGSHSYETDQITRDQILAKTTKGQAKSGMEQPIEFDRRGKPLPPRQRVGGIITPQ